MSNILYVNLIEFKELNQKHQEVCYAIVAHDSYDTSFNEINLDQLEELKTPIDTLEYIRNANGEKWHESFEIIVNEDGGKALIAYQPICITMDGTESCFSQTHAMVDCDDV